jgi:TolA-binding protein
MDDRRRRVSSFHQMALFVGLALSAFVLVSKQTILSQSRQSASVNVQVTEDDREDSIFQAEVRLYTFGHGTYTHRGFTDGAGRVTFQSIQPGNYELEVEKDGYEKVRQGIDARPGAYENYSVRLRRRPQPQAQATVTDKVTVAALTIPASARKEYLTGVRKLKEGSDESIRHFRKAINDYPQYAEAYAMLGVAQMRAKQNDEAMASLAKAIELDPHVRIARTSMGELLLSQKQYARAETELLKGLELDSQAWDTQVHLARCYFHMGKLDQALEYARRAQSLPEAPTTTRLLLVDIYLRQNNPASALQELEAFAKADPHSALMPRVEEMIKKLRNSAAETQPKL